MNLHERFQAHCLTCSQVFEADTAGDAITLAMAHELKMVRLVKEGKYTPKTHKEIEQVVCPKCNGTGFKKAVSPNHTDGVTMDVKCDCK